MRFLFVVSAASLLGGCGLIEDCGTVEPLVFFSDVTVETAGVPATDTLTILFVRDAIGGEFRTADVMPTPSGSDALRLTVEGEAVRANTPPRFETAVRGDTVFVREARDLFREACTPGWMPYYDVVGVEAPAGVRAVRVRTAWAGEVPFPAAVAPSTRAPHFFTV